jgi:hypothetical protein
VYTFLVLELGAISDIHLVRQIRISDAQVGRSISREDDGHTVRIREEINPVSPCEPPMEDGSSFSAASVCHQRRARTLHFRVCSHMAVVPDGQILDERRAGVASTEILLAFPVDRDGHAIAARGEPLFAFLPVRCYGFAFLAQGDFILVTSREDVAFDNAWNVFLRNQIADVFVRAFEELFKRSGGPLAAEYFTYLRTDDVSTPFFTPVVPQILDRLRQMYCVLTESLTWQQPKWVVLPDAKFPGLISNDVLVSCLELEYIAEDTPSSNYKILEELGCRPFDFKLLRMCLQRAKLGNEKLPNGWYLDLFEYFRVSLDAMG